MNVGEPVLRRRPSAEKTMVNSQNSRSLQLRRSQSRFVQTQGERIQDPQKTGRRLVSEADMGPYYAPRQVVPVMYVENPSMVPMPYQNHPNYHYPPPLSPYYYAQPPMQEHPSYYAPQNEPEFLQEYFFAENVPQEPNAHEECVYYSSDYETVVQSEIRKPKIATRNVLENRRRVSRGSQTKLNIAENRGLESTDDAEMHTYRQVENAPMVSTGTQTIDVKSLLDAITLEQKNLAPESSKIEDYNQILKKVDKYFTKNIASHLQYKEQQVNIFLKPVAIKKHV